MLADGCLQGGCSSCSCNPTAAVPSENCFKALRPGEVARCLAFLRHCGCWGALYVCNKLPGLLRCLAGHLLPAGGAHLATLFCRHGLALATASAHAQELPSTWALLCAAGQSAALPARCTL